MSYHSYDFENYKMTYRFKDYAQSKSVLVAFYGNHRGSFCFQGSVALPEKRFSLAIFWWWIIKNEIAFIICSPIKPKYMKKVYISFYTKK